MNRLKEVIPINNTRKNIARAKAESIDLTGEKFGRLTVLKKAEPIIDKRGTRNSAWECLCDCGNIKIVRQSQLVQGKTKSCGCLQKEAASSAKRTHGLSRKCGRIYPLWKSIKYRCYSKTSKDYERYGGRGIVMCDEWRDDFKSFYDWAINNGYKEEKTDKGLNVLTIDRIDVNGNYEPGNCRFVTNEVQARNKRDSIRDNERFKICPICGKRFEISQRNGSKTCSRKCGAELKKINHPNTKDYTKICPVCGKKFNAKRGGHYNQAVYCSRECKNLSESPIWELNGESHRVVEWAEITGINAHCLLHRKDLGWDIERILTTPIRAKRGEKN